MQAFQKKSLYKLSYNHSYVIISFNTKKGDIMTAQDKELAQLHDTIISDVNSLVDKYMSIVGWDVPENNEDEAKDKILAIIKDAIKKIEEEN